MADGALNTIFTQEEFDKTKQNLSKELNHKKSVPAVAGRVVDASLVKIIHQENT
jgi:hypothetical protein